MTKSTITRERLEWLSQISCRDDIEDIGGDEIRELARMALSEMDSESWCLPLDYLQGHKDGLEWASQLAEANHPETGDWLHDDPIELAKAIRKGPDMPPAQPAADSEPVAWTWHYREQWHVTNDKCRAEFVAKDGDMAVLPLYRHAQPAPVVQCPYPCGWDNLNKLAIQDAALVARGLVEGEPTTEAQRQAAISNNDRLLKVISACRAAMLAAAPQSPGSEPATVPGKWIPVSERMPEDRISVILWDAEIGEVTSGHYSHKTQTFYHCGDAIGNEITHWMPPPAAPQEPKP